MSSHNIHRLGICIYWLFFAAEVLSQANLETLQLVQVLFRHGDRTPEYAYTTDPYQDESIWPEGWGQLTNIGKKQEYDLGQYLRSRYDSFLSDEYKPEEIYILSSDVDRTIMSAQINLAGMYPADNGTEWDPNMNWQPVPIRTIATEHDNIIRMKRKCPKLDQVFDDFLYNSEIMKKMNTENAGLFKYLSDKSGENVTTVMGFDDFYATLIVEHLKNLTLPEWTLPLFDSEPFQYLYNFSMTAKTYTDELKRLRAGQLVKYLVENINRKVSDENMKTKFVMLSGHDITIVDLLNTFRVLDLQIPDYASVVIMELHKNSTGNFYFNILYRNDTARAPYELILPCPANSDLCPSSHCGFDCPLEVFLEITQPIIPEDWEAECLSTSNWSATTLIALLGWTVAVIFLASLIAALIVNFILKRRQNPRKDYQPV